MLPRNKARRLRRRAPARLAVRGLRPGTPAVYDLARLGESFLGKFRCTFFNSHHASSDFLESGKIVVFSGPIKDQEGNVKVEEGATLGEDAMGSVDWFVEGVVGSPK